MPYAGILPTDYSDFTRRYLEFAEQNPKNCNGSDYKKPETDYNIPGMLNLYKALCWDYAHRMHSFHWKILVNL